MIGIDVTIRDGVTSKVQAVRDAYQSGRHLKVMAASGANVVKEHFNALERSRHRGGRFHFYARAARATAPDVRGNSAVVVVDHEGIALRYFGAKDMTPRQATFFTIPVDPISQGRRVREFGPEVEWIINRRKGTGVVKLGDRVIYALTQKVTHNPDPTVLPKDDVLLGTVADDLRTWTERLEARANG